MSSVLKDEGDGKRNPYWVPSWYDGEAARQELKDKVICTPVRRLSWLEYWTKVPVWAKLDCQQITGSFKYRGATYKLREIEKGSTVIAASAGNHGYAVAEAARRRGILANVCVPTTCSPIKRDHILATGQGLIECGSSLEDATREAILLSERNGWTYISPYNDLDIIAGQSTLALELLSEVPNLTSLVVPIGGGGLACGCALAARSLGSKIPVFGVEPRRYASFSNALASTSNRRVPHQPTIADGLAVNLEDDAVTLPLGKALLNDIVTVSEEELAACTLAVLFHESILVEPAGAAAIVGAIRLAELGVFSGAIGIPLCGGNLHHSALAKLQGWTFTDRTCQELLDLRGRSVGRQRPPRVMSSTLGTKKDSEVSSGSVLDDLRFQLVNVIALAENAETRLSDFQSYCRANYLVLPKRAIDAIAQVLEKTKADCSAVVEALANLRAVDTAEAVVEAETSLRVAIQLVSAASNALEWRSPSYAQSGLTQFFDIGRQDSPGVNYDRYENAETKRIERQLLEAFGLPSENYAATVTSSGMAAYSLIEAVLIRSQLARSDTVMISSYIYFEAVEQISSIPGVNIIHSAACTAAELLGNVLTYKPRILFVDPLTNNAAQRMIDIEDLVQGLAKDVRDPITLVIDGSMLPIACAGALAISNELVEIFYYESCSKYLQLGLDITMAGVVLHAATQKPLFDRIRRNMGSILYQASASNFPYFTAAQVRARLKRISRAAARAANTLNADASLARAAKVIHPSLSNHPDHSVYKKLGMGGGCLTFDFYDKGAAHRDQLEAFVDKAIIKASRLGVFVSKGVSFGFTHPRISAASSMAENDPPFLRIYVGDISDKEVDLLCEVISDAFSLSGGLDDAC